MQSNTKDWIQYGSAIAMILSAIVLAFLSFFAIQAIEASILWYVAQALAYAGGIFGVSIYIKSKLGEATSQVRDRIREEVRDQFNRAQTNE